ncbi:MAG: flagellar hook-basal body complex protein FliE [Thermodesulfobacteriota bacterium]|nr:flagellar hook-basal body complex protein FliE [Thermodesulfobacteriota bacterium]
MEDLKIEGVQSAPLNNNKKVNSKGTPDFSKIIKGAINNVNKLESDANKSVAGLLQGKANISEAMIALQKVDISMRYLMAIRNKAMQAYREIIHMQF